MCDEHVMHVYERGGVFGGRGMSVNLDTLGKDTESLVGGYCILHPSHAH